MDEPFPILTDLRIHGLEMDAGPAGMAELPDAFLGGSAPHLQSFVLEGVIFRALPNLVLSATHLHHLQLLDTPHAGYIPPEVMVTFLLPLHSLDRLVIGFTSPESSSPNEAPSFDTRSPALSHSLSVQRCWRVLYGFHRPN